ncbi:hypothetical protein SVIOM74S_06042 [Streptomyces violarus]
MARTLLLWGLAAVFPLPLVLTLNAQLTDVTSMRLYISLGLVAYCWWLLAILLSVRPSWLDRAVGLRHIYALHGVLGILALIPHICTAKTLSPRAPGPGTSVTGRSGRRSRCCAIRSCS